MTFKNRLIIATLLILAVVIILRFLVANETVRTIVYLVGAAGIFLLVKSFLFRS